MNPKDKFKKSLLTSQNAGGGYYGLPSVQSTSTPSKYTPPTGIAGNMSLNKSTSTIGSGVKLAPQSPKLSTYTLPGSNGSYVSPYLSAQSGDRSKLTVSGTPTISSLQKDVATSTGIKTPQYGPIQPADVGATGTTGTNLSAAGKTYAQQLADITSGVQNVQSGLDAYKKEQTTPEEEYKNSAEYKAYLKYMREQQNPTEANNTAKERADALKVLADVQKRKEEADLEARRRYEEILDKSGGLKAGAEQSAALDRRRSNQELADLALQESAAARTAGVYDDIYQKEQAQNRPLTLEEATSLGVPFGTTMSEATAMGKIPEGATKAVEGFNLGKEQTRWEYDSETGQYVEVARGASAGADGEAPGTISPYQQERMRRNLNAVDDLYARVGPWTTGFGSLLDAIPTSDAKDFAADLAELKANIAFGELTAMRDASKTGGALGAISEMELKLLEQALGSLDTGQSAANFRKNLEKIKESIDIWASAVEQYGGESGGEFTWDNI